jgi:hypothetical protein
MTLSLSYQHLVRCLLYLLITTRPDIAFTAMWLGQFASKPTCSHFLLAKHVWQAPHPLSYHLDLCHFFPQNYVAIYMSWVVLMQTGHWILWTAEAFLTIVSFLTDH